MIENMDVKTIVQVACALVKLSAQAFDLDAAGITDEDDIRAAAIAEVDKTKAQGKKATEIDLLATVVGLELVAAEGEDRQEKTTVLVNAAFIGGAEVEDVSKFIRTLYTIDDDDLDAFHSSLRQTQRQAITVAETMNLI